MSRARKDGKELSRPLTLSISGRVAYRLGRIALERSLLRSSSLEEKPSFQEIFHEALARELLQRIVGRWLWYVSGLRDGHVVEVELENVDTGEIRKANIEDPDYSSLGPGFEARMVSRIAQLEAIK